jgi:heptosyltransferase-1
LNFPKFNSLHAGQFPWAFRATDVSEILFVKTSSLGDVIHHMPALTEARRLHAGSRFTWVVEETFAPLVRLHPGVDKLIPVAWRRWRKSLYAPATMAEIAVSLRAIRASRYDEIVDSQGLIRSAVIARIARGRRHGYDSRSIREPLASVFYDVRHSISRDLHAVERIRILTGRALGYTPQGAPDYGLDRAAFAAPGQRYALLLHATAQPDKEWPEANWTALVKAIGGNGLDLVLLWGNSVERERAERIAAGLPGARVGENQPLDAVAGQIAGAEFVVGVDTGLVHLAVALGVPAVVILTRARDRLAAPPESSQVAVLGAPGSLPTVADVVRAVEQIAACVRRSK